MEKIQEYRIVILDKLCQPAIYKSNFKVKIILVLITHWLNFSLQIIAPENGQLKFVAPYVCEGNLKRKHLVFILAFIVYDDYSFISNC